MARRLLLVLVVATVTAACQVRVEVNIDVEEDGSGVVEIGAGLDDDALDDIPDLAEFVRTEDLEATGWEVTVPAKESDGLTWIRASKPFGTADEAAVVLAEVAGEEGPFREFAVTRDDSFTRTEYGFRGVVDFARGVEAFSDPELTEALDGEPLGESVEEIEKRFGAKIDELIKLQVAVRLPGEVTSNAPTKAENGAAWQPSVVSDEPVELRASSEVSNRTSVAWIVLGGLAGFVAILVVLVRAALWLRNRGDGRGSDGLEGPAAPV